MLYIMQSILQYNNDACHFPQHRFMMLWRSQHIMTQSLVIIKLTMNLNPQETDKGFHLPTSWGSTSLSKQQSCGYEIFRSDIFSCRWIGPNVPGSRCKQCSKATGKSAPGQQIEAGTDLWAIKPKEKQNYLIYKRRMFNINTIFPGIGIPTYR